jgi:TPR repeat protein
MRKALSWFSKAASSGFAPALYAMAVLYKQGQVK